MARPYEQDIKQLEELNKWMKLANHKWEIYCHKVKSYKRIQNPFHSQIYVKGWMKRSFEDQVDIIKQIIAAMDRSQAAYEKEMQNEQERK